MKIGKETIDKTTKELTQRERFLRTLRFEPTDHRPVYLADPWMETITRWYIEGLPAHVTDIHEFLDVKQFGYIQDDQHHPGFRFIS